MIGISGQTPMHGWFPNTKPPQFLQVGRKKTPAIWPRPLLHQIDKAMPTTVLWTLIEYSNEMAKAVNE